MLSAPRVEATLVVFADDWGRHPSSCQHLIRHLLPRYRVYWINTIGTRPPRWDWATLRRGLEKLRDWSRPKAHAQGLSHPHLTVLNPRMWPYFTRTSDRRLNRWLLTSQLVPYIEKTSTPRVGITTLPITGDLMHTLPMDRWIYYCVDDFASWPGLDHRALSEMEKTVVEGADCIVAVSDVLRERIARLYGRNAALLTHGVELSLWQQKDSRTQTAHAALLESLEKPLIGFWGLIHNHLDPEILTAVDRLVPRGTIVLIGPLGDPPPRIWQLTKVKHIGPVPMDELPALATGLDILILPYADVPSNRACQPLKLKEYLATGKPVVARDLPALREWADCVDLAGDAHTFAELVCRRLASGLPEEQRQARSRLHKEDWACKAALFEGWLHETLQQPPRYRGKQLSATSVGRRTHTHAPGEDGRADRLAGENHLSITPSEQVSAVLHAARVAHVQPATEKVTVLDVRVVTGTGGGPEKTILNGPRYLRQSPYRTICVYLHPPGDPGIEVLRRRAEELEAPFVGIADRGPLDYRSAQALVELCKREKVRIWHAHDYKTDVLGLLLRRLWPMMLVTTVHGWAYRTAKTPLYHAVDRACLAYYDAVVCVSQDLYRIARRARVPRRRCFLIENGIDAEIYRRHKAPSQARRDLGLPWPLLVGAVGRLSEEKGFDILLAAAAQLMAEGLDFGVVLVGDGPQKQSLSRLACTLGIQERVHFAGYQPDPRPWYEAMDVYVLSSRREGLPNAVLEAMAMEVPVIGTRIAGVPRLIVPDRTGLLVPPEDVAMLAQALRRVLTDPDRRHKWGQAARQRILEQFSFAARMQKLRAVYDKVLSG